MAVCAFCGGFARAVSGEKPKQTFACEDCEIRYRQVEFGDRMAIWALPDLEAL